MKSKESVLVARDQMNFLNALHKLGGCTIGELASELGIPAVKAQGILALCIRDSVIARHDDPTDKPVACHHIIVNIEYEELHE